MDQNFKYYSIIVSFLCLVTLFGCKNTGENSGISKVKKPKNGYLITGHTSTSASNILLFDKDTNHIKTAKIKKNAFSFSGKTKQPEIAFLRLNTQEELHPIVLENATYNVLADNFSMKIIGGTTNQKLSDYLSKQLQLASTKSDFHHQFSDRDIALRPYLNAVDSIRRIEKNNLFDFIVNNGDNLLSKYMISRANLSSKSLKNIQNQLATIENNELKEHLNTLVADKIIAEAREKIERRPKAYEFSGTNLDGGITSLSKVKQGKKAVLIDFWASWCAPCRVVSPTVRRLYYKYKNKGFDIVTVSQDRSVNAWEVGVYDDGMEEWNHVYDANNSIASTYGVRGIPHMVLLDEKGRIIKNKISLTEIEEYLEEHL